MIDPSNAEREAEPTPYTRTVLLFERMVEIYGENKLTSVDYETFKHVVKHMGIMEQEIRMQQRTIRQLRGRAEGTIYSEPQTFKSSRAKTEEVCRRGWEQAGVSVDDMKWEGNRLYVKLDGKWH